MKNRDKGHLKIGLALVTAFILLFGSIAGAGAETTELSKAVFYVH